MGMTIQCVLEHEVLDAPYMEGKSLLTAYCGEGIDCCEEETQSVDNIIPVNFRCGESPAPKSSHTPDPLLAPLDNFLCQQHCLRWHDANVGLEAVRGILDKLRDGDAMVQMPSDWTRHCDQREFNNAVIFDLEQLELILEVALKKRTRFCLVFDV